MQIIKPGHLYILDHLDGEAKTQIQFVQRRPFHNPKEGVTNQEVLRTIVDRVKELDKETPWDGNKKILFHLRMAIALHEARAIERHIEKHMLEIENFELGPDGHWSHQ